MSDPTRPRRSARPSEVMALSFLAILATHLAPRLAEDHPWISLAWGVLLTSMCVAACVDVVLERRRE